MTKNMEKVINDYVTIRAERTRLKDEFTKVDERLRATLDKIESRLLKYMEDTGQTQVKTPSGTAYRQEKVIPQGADWMAFYKWVAKTGAFDALERRIKASFIKEYMEENDGDLPPGVSVYREFEARVRKS